MKSKTEIEKIIDAIESKERIKKQGKTLIPKYKQKVFDKEVDESVYSEYHLKEMELLLKLQYGLSKGLKIKDALYISKHRYKEIPTSTVSDLLCEYTNYGPDFIQENSFNGIKKRIILNRK